jgi:hypothetical protein
MLSAKNLKSQNLKMNGGNEETEVKFFIPVKAESDLRSSDKKKTSKGPR